MAPATPEVKPIRGAGVRDAVGREPPSAFHDTGPGSLLPPDGSIGYVRLRRAGKRPFESTGVEDDPPIARTP
jgi:hypothetical protein